MKAISLRGIEKTYPANQKKGLVPALKGIDLDVDQGTILCILGPNGAGKTTLIAILSTLLYPDKGRGTICGFDLISQRSRIREVVNLASGSPNFTDNFTIEENLHYYGMLYGIPKGFRKKKISSLVEMFELEAFRQTPFNHLSTGLKQRLALAKSLINSPQILFLDEPTVSLDPQISKAIHRQLKALNREEGLTIILTTHQMDEAELLSDRIVFLKKGSIISEGTARDLKRRLQFGDIIRIHYSGPSPDQGLFFALDGILKIDLGENRITLTVDDRRKRLDPLIRMVTSQKDVVLQDIEFLEPDLGDVFLELAQTPD
jgi:ABC-2 type transport system ATP-binding protein